MIIRSQTPATSSVHGLVAILTRPDWSTSDRVDELRTAATGLLDHPDSTVRMLATRALPGLFADPAELHDELARRLLSESTPSVRSELLTVMWQAFAGHPAYVDDVLARLASQSSWPPLAQDAEIDIADGDTGAVVDEFVIQLLIRLSIMHDQPFAGEILKTWLTAPADHPARASQVCFGLRPYLNAGTTQVSDFQTERAFEALATPISEAIAIWDAATSASRSAPLPAGQAAMLAGVIKVSEAIGREIYFASGAAASGYSAPTPAPERFAKHAFPVLENLAHVTHPAVVQRVVQILDHLAGNDPRRAFLAIAAAATTGHGYEWESQGADLIVKIVDRYAADHRDLLLTERECLAALRRLLEAFVRSGWDQAIDRVQGLSEFLY